MKKLFQKWRLLRALNRQLFAELNMNWYGNASSTCRRIDRVKGKPVAKEVFYVCPEVRDGFSGLSFRRYSIAGRLAYLNWKYGGGLFNVA